MRENVLSAIEQGKLKRRPKWSFLLHTWLLLAGIFLLVLILLFLTSFVVFALHQNGVWFAPGFGVRGLQTFFLALPWLLLCIVALIIFLLELLLQRYSFAYKRPVAYSFVAIGFVTLLGTTLISTAHVHERLLDRAERHHLPLGEPFYRKYGMPHADDVTPGVITQKILEGFELQTRRSELVSVRIVSETRFPPGTVFMPGEMVVVLGHRQGTMITAMGIKKIYENRPFFPHPPSR